MFDTQLEVYMTFNGFTQDDFHVFKVDGLDERMDALKTHIRPKLEELGQYFAPTLSSMVGDEMFYHVAKHARRTINPPKDTWVAFAPNKRGYKMMPHFQIGLWESHVFIWFAVIYEAPIKGDYSKTLLAHLNDITQQIPDTFVWSKDHMKPEVLPMNQMTDHDLKTLFERLGTVKKAEILCGRTISAEDAVSMSGEEWLALIDDSFRTLQPLYDLTKTKVLS